MSTPTAFNYVNLGFLAHISNANRLKASSSFLKWNMHGQRVLVTSPLLPPLSVGCGIRRICQAHRLNVVPIAKESEIPLQQQKFLNIIQLSVRI